MGASLKAQQLRELMAVARKLRASAAQPSEHAYAELFLTTARVLEERAYAIAYGVPRSPQDHLPAHPPIHFDVIC